MASWVWERFSGRAFWHDGHRDEMSASAMALDNAESASETYSPLVAKKKLMLWVDDVTVDFDGFLALEHLTLTVDQGELRCIIGPNGAGKTTLMDVITGKTRATSGAVYLEDQSVELTKLPEWR